MADATTDIENYVALTLVLTSMAGIIQFAMGMARMGKLVNFVSHSVIIGFTAGAGVLIAFKQLQHVFGLDVERGSSFYTILKTIITNIDHRKVKLIVEDEKVDELFESLTCDEL